MLTGLIKLIILAAMIVSGVAIYQVIEEENSESYTSSDSSGFQSIASERPSTDTYKSGHPNAEMGGESIYNGSYNTNNNINCNTLSSLKRRVDTAYNNYLDSGKQWDYDTYYDARSNFEKLKKQCY